MVKQVLLVQAIEREREREKERGREREKGRYKKRVLRLDVLVVLYANIDGNYLYCSHCGALCK